MLNPTQQVIPASKQLGTQPKKLISTLAQPATLPKKSNFKSPWLLKQSKQPPQPRNNFSQQRKVYIDNGKKPLAVAQRKKPSEYLGGGGPGALENKGTWNFPSKQASNARNDTGSGPQMRPAAEFPVHAAQPGPGAASSGHIKHISNAQRTWAVATDVNRSIRPNDAFRRQLEEVGQRKTSPATSTNPAVSTSAQDVRVQSPETSDKRTEKPATSMWTADDIKNLIAKERAWHEDNIERQRKLWENSSIIKRFRAEEREVQNMNQSMEYIEGQLWRLWPRMTEDQFRLWITEHLNGSNI